jgi:hypothetical protein
MTIPDVRARGFTQSPWLTRQANACLSQRPCLLQHWFAPAGLVPTDSRRPELRTE